MREAPIIMSNTAIRSAVESAVRESVGTIPSGYEGVVTQVIEAVSVSMESLAESVADSIRTAASSAEVDADEVERVLVSSGLVAAPEPTPEVETVVHEGTEDRLSKIEAQVDRLVQIARDRLGLTV